MADYDKKTKKWRGTPRFNGQRLPTKSFTSKTLADQYEKKMERQAEENFVKGTQFQDHSYDEISKFWFDDASIRKRDSSLEKDRQMHRDYISPVIGSLRISQITTIHLNTIVGRLLNKGLSKSSANKVIQHIKAVFNYSFNHELISRNPTRSFKQLKLEKKEMDFLEQDELDQLLTYTNLRFVGEERWIHTFYLTLFLTGMRLGEALGLQWHKIYFDRNSILISDSWCSKQHILLGTTKGKKDRVIPLPSLLKRELAALKNKATSPFIFSNVTGRPIDANNFRGRTWAMGLEACELRHIRIHDARHTYASLFMMNGGSLYDLKAVLGHADIKTTERYAHLSSSHLLGVRDIIQPNIGKKADLISVDGFSKKQGATYPPQLSERGQDDVSVSV
jgi:site-specific recombinase XerD